MTTERIDIVIREDGSRVVRRNIEAIGESAQKTVNPIEFMKRALAGIGAAVAVREVLRLADTYTSLQNRLRSTGVEGVALTQVYKELLNASNSTFASLEGSVEIYSRLAVSAKELGVSQRELIDFTTSLNQAVALGGATATEAENAIRQLSQGMASGTLRGEELNAVLEQLPIVADVIAKQMKITRGELRQMGQDGKITAQTVLAAFQAARGELADRFAKAVPTMSQALQVLKNNFLDLVGRLDQATGISTAISTAIMAVARNLDNIASAIGRAAQSIGVFLAAYGTLKAALTVGAWMQAAQEAAAFSKAVAAGEVVILGSAEAERQRAASALASAQAQQVAVAAQNAANVQAARGSAIAAEAAVAEVAARQAAIVSAREEVVAMLAVTNANINAARVKVAAAQASGAQTVGSISLTAATEALAVAEQHRAALLTELAALGRAQASVSTQQTAALTAQTAAQEALNVATTQAAASNAAAAATAGKAATNAATAAAAAAGTTTLWGQAMTKLGAAASAAFAPVARLFVLVNAHPFVALLTAIVAVIGILTVWGDKMDAGIDGITNMKDVLDVLARGVVDAFKSVATVVSGAFNGVLGAISSVFSSITGITQGAISEWLGKFSSFYDDVGTGFIGALRAIARTFDAIGGLVTGLLIGIGRGFGAIPKLFKQIFSAAYNVVAEFVENSINTTIGGMNQVRALVGKGALELVKINRAEVDEQSWSDYGRGIMDSIQDGFNAQGGFFEKQVNQLAEDAQKLSREKAADAFRKGEKDYANSNVNLDAKGPAAPIKNKEDEKAMKRLKRELESLIGAIAPIEAATRDYAAAQEVLNQAFKAGLIGPQEYSRYLKLAAEYYKDLIDPLGKINRELDENTKLLSLNSREREIESQMLEITNDLKRQGKDLDAKETAALRQKLQGYQMLQEAVQAQDALLEESVESRRKFVIQLEQIQNLLADPSKGFTKLDALRKVAQEIGTDALKGTKAEIDIAIGTLEEQYDKIAKLRDAGVLSPDDATKAQNNATFEFKSQLQSANAFLFEGTQEQLDLQAESFKRMYEQIDAFRQQDLISEQTAAQMKAKVAAAQQEVQLQNAHDFFGNLAALSQSENKKLAAIGKAAAVTQATIDGVVAVQKALASAPPPVNYALAAAVGVAAAANVAKIMGIGFKTGGYTGSGGVNDVAGVVHGKEFVVNAEATARNRALLEAMNKGMDLTGVLPPAVVHAAASTKPEEGYKEGGYAGPRSAYSAPPLPQATQVAAPAQQSAPSANPAQLNAKIINVLDPAIVEDYLTSPAGEQVFVNMMRRNADSLRTAFQEG